MRFLQPGEIHFSETSAQVTTILGSCLAVTMWEPNLKIGAICHALLPSCPNSEKCSRECPDQFKYVECTIAWMIEKFQERAIKRSTIECKVFGGGDMFPPSVEDEKRLSVGKQNVKMALRILKMEGLRVVAQDLEGTIGRKIIFNSENGQVLMKRIR
jgi:chemotaxis protein CheD